MSFPNISRKKNSAETLQTSFDIVYRLDWLSNRHFMPDKPRNVLAEHWKEWEVFMFTVKLHTRCAFENRVKRFSMLLTAHRAANVFNVNCFASKRRSHVHINALSFFFFFVHSRSIDSPLFAVCWVHVDIQQCSCHCLSVSLWGLKTNYLIEKSDNFVPYSIPTAINQMNDAFSSRKN